MRLASIQKLEDVGVVKYIALQVWTPALGGIYHGDKFDILLYSGNILNMFEIQKCWSKMSQKDEYLFAFQNTLLNIGPTLHWSNGNDIFFGLFLPWS